MREPHDAPPGSARRPRVVSAGRAIGWYSEGMALFKRAPLAWAGLGAFTVACQFALQFLPGFGHLLDKVLMPLVGAGLLIAADAVHRGERPALRQVVAIFRAPVRAQLAVILAGLVTFAAEAATVHWLTGVNLLLPGASVETPLSALTLFGAFAIGILVSLPVTFVPFLALFEARPVGASFTGSLEAFFVNTVALLLYGAIGLLLLGFGVVTMGIGLVIVFPLWATASYAAWREIFR